MTNFKGDYVTEDDVKIEKNYLSEVELQRLNLLVSQFLDYAEMQALEHRTMTMDDWVKELDNEILHNRRKILEGNGKISHDEAMKKSEEEFKIYREREMKELVSDYDLLMKSLPNKKNEWLFLNKNIDFKDYDYSKNHSRVEYFPINSRSLWKRWII